MDKAAIFAAANARKSEIVPVSVPEYGQTWYVKEMGPDESIAFAARLDEMIEAKRSNAWFACFVICDDAGARMFDEKDVSQIHHSIAPRVLRRVWRVGAKLNGLNDEDESKNSTTPSAFSSST